MRVKRHAFGENVPHRDLLLSPEHAVFVDDVLIPIRHLINGTTIAQEKTEEITYYHVELPAHGILLAEGLPAESYLDTGNRNAFSEADSVSLHPDFARGSDEIWAEHGCAPLIQSGPILAAVRVRLAQQAARLGAACEPEMEIMLITSGTVSAVIPAGARNVRLVSSSVTPPGDRRPATAGRGDRRIDAGWEAACAARSGLKPWLPSGGRGKRAVLALDGWRRHPCT